jgi:hypothetical protein
MGDLERRRSSLGTRLRTHLHPGALAGVCHTCITPILSGHGTYVPNPLELPGRDEALICCAQPHSDVVLDL